MREADFQSKIIKFLKFKGCYVVKINQDAKSHAGVPDIFLFKDGFWGAIEVKKSKNSKFQPLQKETVAKLNEMSWAKVAYPEVWPEIQEELEVILA